MRQTTTVPGVGATLELTAGSSVLAVYGATNNISIDVEVSDNGTEFTPIDLPTSTVGRAPRAFQLLLPAGTFWRSVRGGTGTGTVIVAVW